MDFSRLDLHPYNILVVFHALGSKPKTFHTRKISIKTDVCISLYDVNSGELQKSSPTSYSEFSEENLRGLRPIGRLNTNSA